MNDEKINSLEKKIDRILSYLEDDQTTGRKGLFKQTKENTEDIQKLKNQNKIIAGVFAAGGTALGWITKIGSKAI